MADTFTLLVEAKDLGEVVSLSSSTTIVINVKDGNNHPPTIRGQTVGSFWHFLNITETSADQTGLTQLLCDKKNTCYHTEDNRL